MVILLFSQTPLFKNWVKGKIVDQINQSINGRVAIEDLSGSLFSGVSFTGFQLINQRDTIVTIGKIDLDYQPFKLLRKQISIKELTIAETELFLNQRSDSSWNMGHIIKQDTLEKSSAEEGTSEFPFSIELMSCRLTSATLHIQAFDELIPQKVNLDTIEFSGHYQTPNMALELKQCQIQTFSPDIKVENFIFQFLHEKDRYSLENFTLKTARNRMNLKGNMTQIPPDMAAIRVETGAIQWQEFSMFLPDLTIEIKPRLGLDMRYESDSLFILFDIQDDIQKVSIEASLQNLKAFLNQHQDSLVYRVHATFEDIEPHTFYSGMPSKTRLNGDIQLSGRGLSTETAQLDFSGDFSHSLIADRILSELGFNGNYSRGDGTVNLNISEQGGTARVTAYVQDIFSNPQYSLNTVVSGLNEFHIFPGDSLDTNLNLTLALQGSGFDPDHIQARFELAMSPSTVKGLFIDTLQSAGQINRQIINLDTLYLLAFQSSLNASGNINLEGNSNLSYRIQLPVLEQFTELIAADTLEGSAFLDGYLGGNPDSLFMTTQYQLHNLKYNGIFAKSMTGETQLLFREGTYQGNAALNLAQLNFGGMEIDSTQVEAELEQDQIKLILAVVFRENMSAEMIADVRLDSLISLKLPHLQINLDEQRWEGGSPTTEFILDSPNFTIKDFELTSLTDSLQKISLVGDLSLEGRQDFRIAVSHVDLAALGPYISLPFEVNGLFNLTLRIAGVADSPQIDGRWKVNDIGIGKYNYRELEGKMSYLNNDFAFEVGLNARRPSVLYLEGHIPTEISLKEPTLNILLDEPFSIRFTADSLGLDFFASDPSELKGISGIIMSDLIIRNTPRNPQWEGYLQLKNGAFQLPEYGINYDRIALDIKNQDSTLMLQQLVAYRNKGFVKAEGQLVFSENILKGQLSSSQLQLSARDFYVVKHKDFEILVKADAGLSGGPDSSQFSGVIKIDRSSFYVPKILELAGKTVLQEPTHVPLLVQALKISDTMAVTNLVERVIEDKNVIKESDETTKFLNNLSGKLTISLPRNTWLKGPNWRMELDGNLDLVKEGKDFELFGSISIVRGNYDLMGRRFNFREGRLTFKGGKEFNPEIVLEAALELRTSSREKKVLVLFLSGEILQPAYRFTLDGRDIPEADAVSYVVTGRSMDELSYGEQAGFDQSSVATDLASGLLTRQLNKQIGQELNLDYLELKGKNNWQSATFVVGKYITNELFVSYEREFGNSDDNDIAPETITVEYEITRMIYLQLIEGNSKERGVDVIFKVEK
jgi:translocation and assembly module TamB